MSEQRVELGFVYVVTGELAGKTVYWKKRTGSRASDQAKWVERLSSKCYSVQYKTAVLSLSAASNTGAVNVRIQSIWVGSEAPGL